ncbi:MAG: cobalamin biosynthesis protein CobQ [Bacillota bacterium]|nr:cobalamin biosynthesis protein CobQ [Bacillota bacterium]
MKKLIVNWMYPDILQLHGDRGNLMALERLAALCGVGMEIRRLEGPEEALPLQDSGFLVFNAGELRCMEILVRALAPRKAELEAFVEKGGVILAIANSGAIFARQTRRIFGNSFEGLGLLDMEMEEREAVYGDDIRFLEEEGGLEILGNQIQIVDCHLAAGQAPFGKLLYGYGNDKSGSEGARRKNLIFTNTLGPLLVKNPRLGLELMKQAAVYVGLDARFEPDEAAFRMEDSSAELIRHFINAKPPVS